MLPSTSSPARPAARPSRNSGTQETLSQLARAIDSNPDAGARVLSLINQSLDQLDRPLALAPRQVPSWQRRPHLPSPARLWRVSLTTATLRYKRVEYELRSELSSLSPSGTVLVTGTSVVRRRYRDFVKLHEALSALPVVVPSLPPKSMMSIVLNARADADFVWHRRVGLQLWLRFVCDHHVTRFSTALREFLWENETAAVTGAHFADLNAPAEAALMQAALHLQSEAALVMYGSQVMALTAMQSRLHPLAVSYQRTAQAIGECVRLDGRLGRARTRLGTALKQWAGYEFEAGQSYGFVQHFAAALMGPLGPSPLELRAGPDDSMVSFAGGSELVLSSTPIASSTTTEAIAAPKLLGAGLDPASLKAFAQLVDLWGSVLLPSLARITADPRKVRLDEASRHRADRASAEWTECEGVRPAMVRDAALRLVEDQLRHTADQARAWRDLLEHLNSEPLTGVLSSFESISGPDMADLDASRLLPDKTALLTPPPPVSFLDDNLDKARELFTKHSEQANGAAALDETNRFRFPNPFVRDGSSSGEDG